MAARFLFAFLVQVSVVLCSPKPFDEVIVPQPFENVKDRNVVQTMMSYLETTTQSLRLEIDSLKSSMTAIQHKHSEELAKQRQEFQRELTAIRQLCANRKYVKIEDPNNAGNTTTNDFNGHKGRFKITDDIKGSLQPEKKPEVTAEFDPNKEGPQQDLHQKRVSADRRQPLRRDSKRDSKGGVTTTHVAFFAKLSHPVLQLGDGQTVIFDSVVTNIGNGYDKNVGIFRAPIAGVYLISTSITTNVRHDGHFAVYINQRRETWFIVRGSENLYDESSQTLIVHLDAGDDVTIRSIIDKDPGVHGSDHSLFSGVLLFVDSNEENVIIGK